MCQIENSGVPVSQCYKVTCEECGKTTWAGCGKHAEQQMDPLRYYVPPPEEQHAVVPVIFDPPGDARTTATLRAVKGDHGPMLNNYVRRVKVGGGQHGDVYLCYRLDTRLPESDPNRRIHVAMKSVKRNNPRAEQMRFLRRQRIPASPHLPIADNLNTTEAKIRKEIAIMKKLRHPHVVRLFEVIDDRMKEKIYMVMEYLGGGEVKWRDANDNPILTVSQTRRILRDAVLGLEYLHYQGIIHRDIKPANLLWTEDRRQVKIGDFGVSHFSYAQRLAAAGGNSDTADPYDPILLDDSSLTRRAGTPSFLAPEIVWEHTNDLPSSSSLPSSSTSSTLQDRFVDGKPKITKAIDVWALGVTLYCLLFGNTPFYPEKGASGAGTEYKLYNIICNDDWDVPPTMGADKIPTGGRHAPLDSPGGSIIHLLDHFLQKDYTYRITLDEVKSSPWVLEDLDRPQDWLSITSPTSPRINVSPNEASDAMSVVHFRWRWGNKLVKQVSSLLRTVRPTATPAGAGPSSPRAATNPRYPSPSFVVPGPNSRIDMRGNGGAVDRPRTVVINNASGAFISAGAGGRSNGVDDRRGSNDTVGVGSDPTVRIRRNKSALAASTFRQGDNGGAATTPTTAGLDLAAFITAPAPLGGGGVEGGKKEKGKERERLKLTSTPTTATTMTTITTTTANTVAYSYPSSSTTSSTHPMNRRHDPPLKAAKPKQVRSAKSLRAKSSDGYPGIDKHGHSASSSALQMQGSGGKPRRGSDAVNNLFEPPTGLKAATTTTTTTTTATASSSAASSPVQQQQQQHQQPRRPGMSRTAPSSPPLPHSGAPVPEKKPPKFSLFLQGITNWRPGSKYSAPPTPLHAHQAQPTTTMTNATAITTALHGLQGGSFSTGSSSSGATSPILSATSSSGVGFGRRMPSGGSNSHNANASAMSGAANYPEAYAKKALAGPTPQSLQQGTRRSEEALRYYRHNGLRSEYVYDAVDESMRAMDGQDGAGGDGDGAYLLPPLGAGTDAGGSGGAMGGGSSVGAVVGGDQHRHLDLDDILDDLEGPNLTAARRASSWGQGDRELTEVVSMTSLEHELNDHEMFVGAGGVGKPDEQGQQQLQEQLQQVREQHQQGHHQKPHRYHQHHYHHYRTPGKHFGGGGESSTSASGSGSGGMLSSPQPMSPLGGGNPGATGPAGPSSRSGTGGAPSQSSSAADIHYMWSNNNNSSSSPGLQYGAILPHTPPSPHSAARLAHPRVQLRRESTFDDDGDEEFGKPLMMAVGGRGHGGGRGMPWQEDDEEYDDDDVGDDREGGDGANGDGDEEVVGGSHGAARRVVLPPLLPPDRLQQLQQHQDQQGRNESSIFGTDEEEGDDQEELGDEEDDEDDDDVSSSEADHLVTFSPRRRA